MFIFFQFVPNLNHQELNALNDVALDGQTLAESLTGEGYPTDWTNATVQRIGLVDGLELNETKLALFSAITQEDYYRSKSLFNIRSDFVVFFLNESDGPVAVDGVTHIGPAGVGWSAAGIDLSGVAVDNLASFTRIVLSHGRVTKMVVYAWE
jgi:hypothetical protein